MIVLWFDDFCLVIISCLRSFGFRLLDLIGFRLNVLVWRKMLEEFDVLVKYLEKFRGFIISLDLVVVMIGFDVYVIILWGLWWKVVFFRWSEIGECLGYDGVFVVLIRFIYFFLCVKVLVGEVIGEMGEFGYGFVRKIERMGYGELLYFWFLN